MRRNGSAPAIGITARAAGAAACLASARDVAALRIALMFGSKSSA
jgi:hypothetical protein